MDRLIAAQPDAALARSINRDLEVGSLSFAESTA